MTTQRLLAYLSLVVFSLACTPPAEEATAPRVTIDSGVLEGAYVTSDSEMAVFKGIPFARAPVDDLRWKPPQPVAAWEEIRPATEFGPICPQTVRPIGYWDSIGMKLGVDPPKKTPDSMSEDCLFLNVWTTGLGSETRKPVMVWIHGGGNRGGSTLDDYYDGSYLAEKGVVLVTIQYRLGPFGFLALPALTAESDHHSSGNYGLLDQIEALRWVQNNISVFGGDPERVTIFGESAGGTNVGLLMASPLSDGLFHRAISQSGPTLMPIPTLENAEAAGERLAEELGMGGEADVLATLRNQSADQIIEVAFKHRSAMNPYAPIVDGWVLPDSPGRVFAQGQQQDVPLLIGSTADEGTQLIPLYFPDVDEKGYRAFMETTYGEFAEKVLDLYSLTSFGNTSSALNQWITDFGLGADAILMARAMEKGTSPAYLYHFTRVPPGPAGAEIGAFHGSEIPFVFNTHTQGWPKQPYDDALTETMSAYWVQFAATGNPNREGLPEWPAYDPVTDQHLELGEEVKVGSELRKEAADLLGKMLEALVKQDKASPSDSE